MFRAIAEVVRPRLRLSPDCKLPTPATLNEPVEPFTRLGRLKRLWSEPHAQDSLPNNESTPALHHHDLAPEKLRPLAVVETSRTRRFRVAPSPMTGIRIG